MRLPWISAAAASIGLMVACVPGSAEALQYDRVRVLAGEVWLLLSGQLAHWTARMALVDLGMLAGLGAWLEARGERRELIVALALGAAGTALAVHALSPDLLVYRGSSGLASALFVLVALRIARSSRGVSRALALLAVALFLAKAAWESFTGQALFAGPLAPGVRVVPLVHLLGGVAGAAAEGMVSWYSRARSMFRLPENHVATLQHRRPVQSGRPLHGPAGEPPAGPAPVD